ncbi:MAG: hypothetical protein HC790_07795 [Acaryochloridaceae cyanobacterium CSU_3_4]|nr:hypothetical protein [Acaryochloridaceae cyanobacterium CSU_3_4]
MQPEQEQEIANLRSLNLTPKRIARKLGVTSGRGNSSGLRPKPKQTAIAQGKANTLAPVVECWTNESTANHSFGSSDPSSSTHSEDETDQGMSTVTVTRSGRHNRFVVCTYLLDYWCLGLKDTIGSRKFERRDYTYRP